MIIRNLKQSSSSLYGQQQSFRKGHPQRDGNSRGTRNSLTHHKCMLFEQSNKDGKQYVCSKGCKGHEQVSMVQGSQGVNTLSSDPKSAIVHIDKRYQRLHLTTIGVREYTLESRQSTGIRGHTTEYSEEYTKVFREYNPGNWSSSRPHSVHNPGSIEGYHVPLSSTPFQHSSPCNPHLSTEDAAIPEEEIQSL